MFTVEEQEEYSIFSFFTEKEQTIISNDKLVMKESAAVIDFSTLLLHMALS